MPLTWLTGLYTPTRDLAKGVASLRARGVILTIEANPAGSRTWITVTAQCRPDGKPVTVRGCWAELYETANDACSGPQPVRTRVINFLPGGPRTIRPGEIPARWDAQVLNEYVRRATCELDDAATVETYGEKHGLEVLALRDRDRHEEEAMRSSHPLVALLAEVVGEPSHPKMRAVLETVRGQSLVTGDVQIPPRAPLSERLNLVFAYLAARRSEKAHGFAKKSDEAA